MLCRHHYSVLIFVLGFVVPVVNAEQWKLVENQSSGGKPALVRKVVANSVGRKVSLTLCAFSTKDFTLKVVDQGNNQTAPKYRNLKEAMEQRRCVAGVNGGFFDASFKAFGVVYTDGTRINSYTSSSRSGLASGVIWSGTGGIHIVRQRDFKGGSAVKQAIQTGPMLISNGAQVSGLSKEKSRPRSFVLTDWKGNWMLGTSSFVSLAVLAEILDSTAAFPELKGPVDRAINLDGGRSTGFYLKHSDGQVTYRPEISTVRNFLGLVPK